MKVTYIECDRCENRSDVQTALVFHAVVITVHVDESRVLTHDADLCDHCMVHVSLSRVHVGRRAMMEAVLQTIRAETTSK